MKIENHPTNLIEYNEYPEESHYMWTKEYVGKQDDLKKEPRETEDYLKGE